MRRFKGIGASDGIAIGAMRQLTPRLVIVDRWVGQDEVADQIRRLDDAVEIADQQLAAVSQQLQAESRDDGRAIVEAHRLILRSSKIAGEAKKLIASERLAAESAVRRRLDLILGRFAQMDDPYLRERGGDVEAVGERLLRAIVGIPEPHWAEKTVEQLIGVGTMLSAIDAFRLHDAGFAAIVTERGSRTSHASILVRALGTPYVAGVPDLLENVRPGATLIVDGAAGTVISDPDPDTLMVYQSRRRQQQARNARLSSKEHRPLVTKDGVRIHIGANIETLAEIPRAIDLGAESIGLLRTEFLYLERPDLPSEEEQYKDAVAALASLGGRMATFRTLDLGGEKLPLAVKIPDGPNPSLGVRAIRFSARRPDIFRTQLRALYRASAHGPLRIMFPMISGVAELHAAQSVCKEVRAELEREGVAHDPSVAVGSMIETPSAALSADQLAEACDFFSIGTNDLIQYAFAADRDNQDVYYLYHPLHSAVLRLLERAIAAAGAANKPISLCGDMAGDPAFTWVLIGLGLRELSMTPQQIPAVRSVIEATTLAEAQAMATEALLFRSDQDVESLVIETMRRRFPLEMSLDG